MAGVILFQVPISWLADRYGRLPALLGCYGVVAAGLIAVPFTTDTLPLIGEARGRFDAG